MPLTVLTVAAELPAQNPRDTPSPKGSTRQARVKLGVHVGSEV